MALIQFEDLIRSGRLMSSGCIEWEGHVATAGYGMLSMDRRYISVHRAAYESMRGPIGAGLVIDHLCSNRLCFNPWHLDAVPQHINVRRGKVAKHINEAGEFKCGDCGGVDFYRVRSAKSIGGYFRQCIPCAANKSAEYHAKNAEKIRARKRAAYRARKAATNG